MYADALLMMSVSVSDLPLMLDIWADRVCYLGLYLLSCQKFNVDISVTRRNFFISLSCIVSQCGNTSHFVKLYLCEMHCLPILMYASESLYLSSTKVQPTSCWNSV